MLASWLTDYFRNLPTTTSGWMQTRIPDHFQHEGTRVKSELEDTPDPWSRDPKPSKCYTNILQMTDIVRHVIDYIQLSLASGMVSLTQLNVEASSQGCYLAVRNATLSVSIQRITVITQISLTTLRTGRSRWQVLKKSNVTYSNVYEQHSAESHGIGSYSMIPRSSYAPRDRSYR